MRPFHSFFITGPLSTQWPARVFDLFAQRDLPPYRLTIERRGDAYVLEIEHPGLDERTAGLVAEKLRAMMFVETVEHHRSGAGVATMRAKPSRPHSQDDISCLS